MGHQNPLNPCANRRFFEGFVTHPARTLGEAASPAGGMNMPHDEWKV